MNRKTPPGLARGGRALWREVTANRQLRPDEARILLDSCHEVDMIDDLQGALSGAPRTVRGSQGQEVIHPLIAELRMHRQTLHSLLRGLSLADSDTSADDSARSSREAAMALAHARWSRKSA
jgi:hypothetical protein